MESESNQENVEAEVEKTPQEQMLDDIYDQFKSKEKRAGYILDTLEKEPDYFYELDFFKNTFYSHVIQNFTDEGDEEIFGKLTSAVIQDIISKNVVTKIGDEEVNLFDQTFNGDGRSNFGILIHIVKERKFSYISTILDIFIKHKCTDRLNAGIVDNLGRTILHYLCLFNESQLAYEIYIKYRSQYPGISNINLNSILSNKGQGPTIAETMTKNNPLKGANYLKYEQELDKLFERDVTEIDKDPILGYIFCSDSLGVSFIHNLCFNEDHRFISLILSKWSEHPAEFKILTNIEDMTIEMNKVDNMSHLSSINLVLSNGTYHACKAILDHVIIDRSIKISINQKDGRKRNIIHQLIYNKKLSESERLDLIENYLLKLTNDMMFDVEGSSIKENLCQIDKDGFIPIVLFMSLIKVKTQGEELNLKLFQILTSKTDFKKVLSSSKPDNFVHPLV